MDEFQEILQDFLVESFELVEKLDEDLVELETNPEDLELLNGIIIGIDVSWLSPVKVGEMIIWGTKMSGVYDDTIDEKIKLYDAGVVLEKNLTKNELYNYMVQYKYGDIHTPKLPNNFSLNNSIEHFIDCIKNNKTPITSKKIDYKCYKSIRNR
jgi:hypothetical protein